MPKLFKGNILDVLDTTDLLVLPSSASVEEGRLVCNTKVLNQFNDLFDGLDSFAAELINKHPYPSSFGLVRKDRLGLIQTKVNATELVSLHTLSYSFSMLRCFAMNRNIRIDMVYPCTPFEGVKLNDVNELLFMLLPDNVNIWTN